MNKTNRSAPYQGRKEDRFFIHELPNGLRLVHIETPHCRIARCGLVFDVGSRDEPQDKHGLAHFREHMAFKGTGRRKAFHVINRLESVGGELNAFTTKEKIAFYAAALDAHFERSIEIIRDVAFYSSFPEREIERERKVILEEMAMYRDAPDDAIQDDFDALCFDDHPLGANILGDPESIDRIGRQDFIDFVEEYGDLRRAVFCSVGPMQAEKAFRLAEKYFAGLKSRQGRPERIPFEGFSDQKKIIEKPISQTHCIMGAQAPDILHPERLPYYMLVNILGGPGMNSRLNMAVREKKGYAYAIEAGYYSFTDVGQFSVYFATEKSNLKRAMNLVVKEINKLIGRPLGQRQLKEAKEQLKGQIAMAEENKTSMMIGFAKSLLDKGRIQSLEEVFEKIDAVGPNDLAAVGQKFFNTDRFCRLIYLPTL